MVLSRLANVFHGTMWSLVRGARPRLRRYDIASLEDINQQEDDEGLKESMR